MGQRIRAHDWGSSPLGPVEGWPIELKLVVSLMLGSGFPMFVAWGPELIFFYNDGYAPMLGTGKHPRGLGRPMAESWAEIWPTVEPMMSQVMATGEAANGTDARFFFDRHLPQEEVYFTFSYSALHLADGSVGGVFCACTEVTNRVVDEGRLGLLRDLGSKLTGVRSISEACSNASRVLDEGALDFPYALIYRMSPDGRHGELCAASGPELGGPHAPERLVFGDRPIAHLYRDAIDSGQLRLVHDIQGMVGALPYGPWPEGPNTAVIMPLLAPGTPHPIGVFIAGLSSRRTVDEGYLGFVELVASRIARAMGEALTHEQAEARASELAALDRAKTHFFGNVSHELRTPLTLMLGPLGELRETPELGERARENVALAYNNSQRLLRLVNTLLDFSRIEAGRTDALFEPTDLASATRVAASAFSSAMESGGLGYELDLPATGEAVWVDREMWEKVVFNLISNAFKFTLEGSVRVSLHQHDGQAELVVSDTGCGIAPADQEHIFERFQRVRAPQARSIEGTGIGLALVRELVTMHGGTIGVTSEPGQGSRFTVLLPLGHAHLPSDRVATRGRALPSTPLMYESERWRSTLPAPKPAHGARVVVVDDNPDMLAYVTRVLEPHWQVLGFRDARSALEAMRREAPDMVVSDVMLPGMDGFALLQAVRSDERLRGIPMILLSARAGEEARVEGFEAGADGYLIKPFSGRELVARVGAALQLASVRREADLQLQAAEERFRLLQRATNDIVWEWDVETGKVVWNEELERQTGWTRDEVGPLTLAWAQRIHPEDVDRVVRDLKRAVQSGGGSWTAEYRVRKKDGNWISFLDRAFIVHDEQNRPVRMIGALLDVTERERLAEEVRRAERLQAAGKLAGGMAHEVNNMMTAVLGFGDFVLRQLPEDAPARADIKEMVKAGERAARVTQQLLAFTRRQVLQPTLVDVNAVVRELASPLERLAGATVMIATELSPRAGRVRVDRTQLEQVLINLVHNARDAMPSGGAITLATSEINVAQKVSGLMRGEDLEPGRYLVFTVKDTGIGMDDRTLRQAFEPFFTTKPIGQGTGLGLSTVYGTVRQSGGHIQLDSVVGVGTTVTIYLPRVDDGPVQEARARVAGPGGTERILVVEDERVVRSLVARTLADKGFEVIEAEDGIQALQILKQREGKVDLVLSDVVMPRLAGRELGYAIKARYPGLTTVFMSGYTGDEILQRGLMDADALFLPKPFTADQLVEKLREVLDRTRAKTAV